MKLTKGFTLIELVVVIVVLAILTVVAAPRFLSINEDADVSVVKGLKGALSSSFGIAYGKLIVDEHDVTNRVILLDPRDQEDAWCKPIAPEVQCSFAYGYPSSRGTIKSVIELGDDWNINQSGGDQKVFKIYLKKDADTTSTEGTYSDFSPLAGSCYVEYIVDYTLGLELDDRIRIANKNCG
ncbi:prepilin-type N-terminal cleavage/methylation domain-containing protein [Vibrio cortegadensis]|uniref:prepilin-type N-terminal cleavage/methylation domain-containing protein n=1 Tax=Vibrio cortegadensis TaxID=1328770 RepID=UPI00352C85A8